MINFIAKNKEWLFSGIGVTILIVIYAIFKKFFLKQAKQDNNGKTQETAVNLNLSKKVKKPSRNNATHIEGTNFLTVVQINKTICDAPPLQRDEIRNNFKGIKVIWETYLKHARKDINNKDIVRLRLSPEPLSHFSQHTISCKVKLNDYRELAILPEDTKIRIQGEIAEADVWDVELINVKLFFLNNQ